MVRCCISLLALYGAFGAFIWCLYGTLYSFTVDLRVIKEVC